MTPHEKTFGKAAGIEKKKYIYIYIYIFIHSEHRKVIAEQLSDMTGNYECGRHWSYFLRALHG